jgi:methyltransferase (TIGR00027 family)
MTSIPPSARRATVKQEGPQQLLEHEPSKSAMRTAGLRALAALDETVRGPDTLAKIFLPESQRIALQDRAQGKQMFSRHITSMYEFLIARTFFIDFIFEEAVRNSLPQIVFLGAGYDSRPYRFKNLIITSRIFELDTEPTQQRKISILKSNSVSTPRGHVFLPFNFNTENFLKILSNAGFDKQKLTLFICEGVSYYLIPGVFDQTLRLIRSCMPGSSIVFDYARDSRENLQEFLGARYESFKDRFGIKGDIREFLATRGYEVIKHLTAGEMEEKYLSPREVSYGKIPALFYLAHARVA